MTPEIRKHCKDCIKWLLLFKILLRWTFPSLLRSIKSGCYITSSKGAAGLYTFSVQSHMKWKLMRFKSFLNISEKVSSQFPIWKLPESRGEGLLEELLIFSTRSSWVFFFSLVAVSLPSGTHTGSLPSFSTCLSAQTPGNFPICLPHGPCHWYRLVQDAVAVGSACLCCGRPTRALLSSFLKPQGSLLETLPPCPCYLGSYPW